jgi:lysine 2,3-aminomutase
MAFQFQSVQPKVPCLPQEWSSWNWQVKNSLKKSEDFKPYFQLSNDEEGAFQSLNNIFRVQTTPYYASLANSDVPADPIRQILMPSRREESLGTQQEVDPLGENKTDNRPCRRIVHRYSDRVLFLLTDFCAVYCRFCTRKHFTASDQFLINKSDYEQALNYIRSEPGIREVIISGGDPLTLSDAILDRTLSDLRKIENVEVIRLHSRMPVVCPMRLTMDFAKMLKRHKPVYLVTHFNHPDEITQEVAEGLDQLIDNGTPVLNQMVLLNGINNHPAIVASLSRRLLYLRVKPYYLFQCDPSLGTDHLRTSIENSESIQKELWGHLSGLAMPTLIVDLPNGGGKVPLVPDFQVSRGENFREYKGWDGVVSKYINPIETITPKVDDKYLAEWHRIKNQ